MATFTENMKHFTDELATCTHERANDLRELRAETERLVSDAQSFLERLGEEHQAMATQIRSTLTNERQARTEQVAELRQRIGTHLHELREQLQETLQTCRDTRHEHLDRMFQGFQEARHELAKDLQEAGRIWRGQHRRKSASHKRSK